MKRACEEALDNSLRYLAAGKIKSALLRMEAVFEEEGLSDRQASYLARQSMRLWVKWLMEGRRRR